MYQGRFSLLYQRLRRNSRFAPLNAVQVRWVCPVTVYWCLRTQADHLSLARDAAAVVSRAQASNCHAPCDLLHSYPMQQVSSDGDFDKRPLCLASVLPCLCCLQATLPNQMHAQLTELNGLKGNVGRRCIIMGLISSQVGGGHCQGGRGGGGRTASIKAWCVRTHAAD